ncbi:MAG: iron-containing alcohol dehydrogenase [Bacillota bacterium]|nr:iron-containing alcohol dehydrogenase [Bacillota bacterium]
MPTKVIFGREAELQAGEQAALCGKRALVIYGSSRVKESGLLERVEASLAAAGLSYIELSGVQSNPLMGLAREGIELCRRERADLLLAVGGGSVIDTAKTIAMGVPYTGDVWDFFMGRAQVAAALPLGVVLTVPATASETNRITVMTNEDGGLKRSAGSPLLYPVFSLLNPELSFTLPPYQTAVTSIDIMAHTFERYFDHGIESDLLDGIKEALLKAVMKNAPLALTEPENYEARSELMWAASVSHNEMTGIGGDYGSHKLGHELSAGYGLAHGHSLAIAMVAWSKYVMDEDVGRFARFARQVWDVDPAGKTERQTAEEGIARLDAFCRSLGVPTTMHESGIPSDGIEAMADKMLYNSPGWVCGNFRKLYKEDIMAIYELAK